LGGVDGGRQRQSALVVADDADADGDFVVAESVCSSHVPAASFVDSPVLAHQETVPDVVPVCQPQGTSAERRRLGGI